MYRLLSLAEPIPRIIADIKSCSLQALQIKDAEDRDYCVAVGDPGRYINGRKMLHRWEYTSNLEFY